MSAPKKRGRIRQGDPLPKCPFTIGELPIGVAVLLQHDSIRDTQLAAANGDGLWWLMTFRIGTGPGASVNLRRLDTDPSDRAWWLSRHFDRLAWPGTIAIAAAWPARIGDADGDAVTDPLTGLPQSGPLFDHSIARLADRIRKPPRGGDKL